MKVEKQNEAVNANAVLTDTNFESGFDYGTPNYSTQLGKISALNAQGNKNSLATDGTKVTVYKGSFNIYEQGDGSQIITMNSPQGVTVEEKQAIIADALDIYEAVKQSLI